MIVSYPDFDAPGHQVTTTWATWSRFYVRTMGTTAAFVHKTKPAGSPYGKDESEETPAREGGGQGGTKNLSGFSALVLLQKNITVMQFHLNREVGGGRTAFVHLLAGSCVLACDYVSYSVTCIDSPVGVFVHQELLNFFMYIILNHVLSIIIRYIQILYIYIFKYYQIIGFKSFIATPLFRLECGLELRWS